MIVMWDLESDTVEYSEYLTGVRIEGLTYSLFSFILKCGQAIGGINFLLYFGIKWIYL